MEKMKFETSDLSGLYTKRVGGVLPEVVTEIRGKDGEIKKVIDFEKLKTLLTEADEIAEPDDEKYEFTWVGKKASMVEANKPIRKTLRPCKEESKDWDNTENLYIEGDNLEVLKLLQESYLNKIKMIYIDPPYNTGNDFIYNDDFKMDSDEYRDETGEVDEEGNRLFKNTDTNGRFHSDWCSMMYSRLMLARNLLSEDGVIFISIDDNEQENLKKICDEIFGIENFIACIIRNTNSSKNQSLFVSVSHEYCLIYAKNRQILEEKHKVNKWSVPKNNIEAYEKKVYELKKLGLNNDEITDELKRLTKYPRFIDFTNYWYFDERGLYRKDNLGGVKNGNLDPIFNPITNKFDSVPPRGFRYTKEKMEKLIEENRIHFHTDGSLPVLKRYLAENRRQRPKSITSDDQRPDFKLMQEFNTPFDNPKQLSFMKRFISIVDKDSIILDFFSGSATTAHAVMELNAEDGGNRKFIMVQLPEECDEKSEAYKAGYKNICEIGKERIRRAGDKIKADNADKEGIENLDTGFRVLKLDDTNMKDIYYTPDEYSQRNLFDLESNIKEDRTELDLLYGCLIEWGIPLNKSYESTDIDGSMVHIYNDGDLIACFNEDISEEAIKKIAKMEPLRAVFRDSSFKTSSEKINVEEIFKLLSPETSVRVI